MLSQAQFLMIFLVLIGVFIGRKVPFTRNGWIQWYYNRRHIDYFVCHLIDNSSIINTATVKESVGSYVYEDSNGKNTYLLFEKNKDHSMVPYINIGGLRIIFHNKNNINPLKYKENTLEPAYNDPQLFTSFIRNKDIGNVLQDKGADITVIKRYILICSIAVTGVMACIVYMVLQNT